MFICILRDTRMLLALASGLFLLLSAPTAQAQESLTLLVTSNLQGDFSLDVKDQETSDPLLRLGQNLSFERQQGADLLLDLGNAIYPGVLSKYSSGAVMMDFLDAFSFMTILVSSKDLQIGVKNLEFLQKSKNVRVLSANILQDNQPVFTPWFEINKKGFRIAFVGISSSEIRFDMAEKDLYGYRLIDYKAALAAALHAIRAAGIRHIVLLSGQPLESTAAILADHPEIGLAVCGGDNTGRFFSGTATRVDLSDGRSIVMTDNKADYYLLRLSLGATFAVQTIEPKKADPRPTYDYRYQEFKSRLTLWKEQFHEDQSQLVAQLNQAERGIDDLRFSQFLRDRFNSELGVVEVDTINPAVFKRQLKQSDFLDMVHRDYNVFIFKLTGDDLTMVKNSPGDLVIAGMDGDPATIQGYSIVSQRAYRVAATQPAMQKINRLLGREVAYRNTWLAVTELMIDDLKHDGILLKENYHYLDRRFRTTIDVHLSNFFDSTNVSREDNDPPPGRPGFSYTKWGLENRIDVTLYNKYHRFTLTPYMLYSRQDEAYLSNLLRGILLYDYNLGPFIRPYNKLQVDTVVESVEDQEPLLVRETLGFSMAYKYFTGKLGVGFEKEIQDPANAELYGVEWILGARIPFLSYFSYSFDIDTFTGIRNQVSDRWQLRGEINNGLSAQINPFLSLSLRHKYFFLEEQRIGQSYRNSQFIVSLDLKTDWKFW